MNHINFRTQKGGDIPIYYRPRKTQAPDSLSGEDITDAIKAVNGNGLIPRKPVDTDRLELTKKGNKVIGTVYNTKGEEVKVDSTYAPTRDDERDAIEQLLVKFQNSAKEIAQKEKAKDTNASSRNNEATTAAPRKLTALRGASQLAYQDMDTKQGRNLPVFYIPSDDNRDFRAVSNKDVKKALEGVNFLPRLQYLPDNCDRIEIAKKDGNVRGYLYDTDNDLLFENYAPIKNEAKEYKPINDVLNDFRIRMREANRMIEAQREGREYQPSFEVKFDQAIQDFWENESLTGKVYRLFKNSGNR